MNPVQKALWFVESHLREPIALEEIATHSGVSPYHLTRAFDAVTGHSIMRYVRARRLSEAARQLCNGAPDILTVALVARTRSSHHNCRESDCELRVQSATRIIEMLVSFDSEVRFGACGRLGRTSESGH